MRVLPIGLSLFLFTFMVAPASRADMPSLRGRRAVFLQPGEGRSLMFTLNDIKAVFSIDPSKWGKEEFDGSRSADGAAAVRSFCQGSSNPNQAYQATAFTCSDIPSAKREYARLASSSNDSLQNSADWSSEVHLGEQCNVRLQPGRTELEIQAGSHVLYLQLLEFQITGPVQIRKLVEPWTKRSMAFEQPNR